MSEILSGKGTTFSRAARPRRGVTREFSLVHGVLWKGAGPQIRILTPCSATKKAAPLAAVFGEWAPRTSIPWSLVTDNTPFSVIDVADADQPASIPRRRISSLHHHQLLSAQSAAGYAAESRSVSGSHILEIMERVRRRYRFVVVGYMVMPEHVHLLFSEP